MITVTGTAYEIIRFAETLKKGLEAEAQGLSPRIREALSRGDKISAIKMRREDTQCSLREAKDWLDGLPIGAVQP